MRHQCRVKNSNGNKSNVNGFPKVIIYKLRFDTRIYKFFFQRALEAYRYVTNLYSALRIRYKSKYIFKP